MKDIPSTAIEATIQQEAMNMGDFKKLFERTLALQIELTHLLKELNNALEFLNHPCWLVKNDSTSLGGNAPFGGG